MTLLARTNSWSHRLAFLLAISATPLAAAEPYPPSVPKSVSKYPPVMPEATVETYAKCGDTELKLYVFQPTERKVAEARYLDRRPAIVFFFGGGWRAGNPGQFYAHCRYLSERSGLVAVTADYRVSSRHESTPQDAVADAKAAIRYVRTNAKRLGVDPDRIIASGGSAGGHLAACTGVVPGFEPKDAKVSSVPNAMILFNPAVMLAPLDGENLLDEEKLKSIADRTGGKPVEISPIHHVRENLPPTLILHGTKDTAVPFATVERFCERMKEAGNDCTVAAYAGRPHGFFNYSRSKEDYVDTIEKVDAFLVRHGYLAEP